MADVLRLVPGVDVARINGTYSAVSVRGFNNGFAMKLTVLPMPTTPCCCVDG